MNALTTTAAQSQPRFTALASPSLIPMVESCQQFRSLFFNHRMADICHQRHQRCWPTFFKPTYNFSQGNQNRLVLHSSQDTDLGFVPPC